MTFGVRICIRLRYKIHFHTYEGNLQTKFSRHRFLKIMGYISDMNIFVTYIYVSDIHIFLTYISNTYSFFKWIYFWQIYISDIHTFLIYAYVSDIRIFCKYKNENAYYYAHICDMHVFLKIHWYPSNTWIGFWYKFNSNWATIGWFDLISLVY